MKPFIERFEDKIFYSIDGCWYWLGALGYRNYGRVLFNGYNRIASRVSFLLYKSNPKGFLVCHTCDNSMCVNPDHLFLGTHQDNATDKVLKNRQYKKTHCKRGHLLADPNLYHCNRDGKPYQLCKTCVKIRR